VAYSAEARAGGTEKLYIIKHDGQFCYVGRTSQSVSDRIKQGLVAPYPYRWRRWNDVDVHVCVLGCPTNQDFGEGVEAELVYLIRQGTRRLPGRWPMDQHEIHFRHRDGVADPKCVKAARDIYSILAGS
jgi:hypothetical protein